MDAHEPHPEAAPTEEPLFPRPTWKARLGQVVATVLRPWRLFGLLKYPLGIAKRALKPNTKKLAPLMDRLVRLPGAGLTWMLNHRMLTAAATILVLLMSVPLILRQIVIRGIIPPAPPPTVEETLIALDRHDWPLAKRLAESLAESDQLSDEEAGVPPFVLGMTMLQDAEQYEGVRRRGVLAIAGRFLEESQLKGFPAGREKEGQFWLGKSLFETEHFSAAKPVLEETLRDQPEHAKELHSLLAQLYLHGADRDLQKAKQHNLALLASPRLSGTERGDAWLRQGRILYDLQDWAGCAELMEKIPPEAKSRAESNALRGRLLLHAAREARAANPDAVPPAIKAIYTQAIDALRLSLGRGTMENPISREVMYLIGVCLLESGDLRAAADQFARTVKQYPDSEEGVAAGFQRAEILRLLELEDDSIAAFATMVKAAGPSKAFHNPYLALDEIRDRLAQDQRAYLKKQDFERAIRLAEASVPILPADRTAQLVAQAYRAWAAALQAQAETATGGNVELQRQAREKLRQAGRKFAQLADLRMPTRYYPDDLWDSVQASLAGHDYEHALTTLKKYLLVDGRRRRPLALLASGEANLALGNDAQALAALRECIDAHPEDPACYKARVLMARALIHQSDELAEQKQSQAKELSDQAEKLLRENLSGELLTPASLEYRDSLYLLGKLEYERGLEEELFAARIFKEASEQSISGNATKMKQLQDSAAVHSALCRARYEEAVTNLDEALARYPEAPAAMEGRYLMAEAFRHAALEQRERTRSDSQESVRAAHARQLQQMLSQAATQYELLRDQLNRRQERTELTPLEKIILRNSYFFHGAALFEAGRYEEAIHAYSTATNRYQDSPEVLEAYVQIANCNWHLNRIEEYLGTLAQAKVVLKGMQADSTGSTLLPGVPESERQNWRQKWEANLDWLSSIRIPANPSSAEQLTARNPGARQ